jgi:hypothetical protein
VAVIWLPCAACLHVYPRPLWWLEQPTRSGDVQDFEVSGLTSHVYVWSHVWKSRLVSRLEVTSHVWKSRLRLVTSVGSHVWSHVCPRLGTTGRSHITLPSGRSRLTSGRSRRGFEPCSRRFLPAAVGWMSWLGHVYLPAAVGWMSWLDADALRHLRVWMAAWLRNGLVSSLPWSF